MPTVTSGSTTDLDPASRLVAPVRWGIHRNGGDGFVLPVGTVTLLLADIESSSRLWETEPDAMTRAVASYDGLVDEVVGRHAGVRPEEQGEGDSFVAAFSRASDALAAAVDLQRALLADAELPFRVRMALHAGEVQLRDEGNYIGQVVNRAARLRELAWGGQIVVSEAVAQLVADARLADVALVDLGRHRLRDLARPEQVAQVVHPELPASFPPLRSLDVTPHNLPVQLTSFVGRERELDELGQLLADARLVTLVGAGGAGKTRLALHAAARASAVFLDGVFFVDLAPVIDRTLVASAIASALGVREVPGRPLLDTVLAHLAGSRTLLVLDNCEHVVEAAAELAHAVLTACPGVTVLATSRQPLDAEGEVAFRVPPLLLPPAADPQPLEALAAYDAVRLFVERARQARADFTVTNDTAPAVAAICRRLDGIPLAIELAAARVRLLSPDELLAGLDDRLRLLSGGARTRLPRQQTLRASIDWSHDLLDDHERAVFRRLAVFAGSFTLDAAERVAGAGSVPTSTVLDVLGRLVDRSLVQVDPGDRATRYRLLETVRQYALERLCEAGDDEEAFARHRDHYLMLVETLAGDLEGARHEAACELLDADRDNLRLALRWSCDRGDADHALRLVAPLVWYWFHGSQIAEGRSSCERALALPGGGDRARAWALWALAYVAFMGDDPPGMIAAALEAVELFERCDDRRGLGRAMKILAFLQSWTAGVNAAREMWDRSISLARETDDELGLVDALGDLGGVVAVLGNAPEAAPLLTEARARAATAGIIWTERYARFWYGILLQAQGDLPGARAVQEELYDEARRAGDRVLETCASAWLAQVLVLLGDYDGAQVAAGRSADLAAALGNDMYVAHSHATLAAARSALGSFDPSLCELTAGAVAYMRLLGPLAAYVLPVEALAALANGEAARAEALLDEAVGLARGADAALAEAMACAARGRALLAVRGADAAAVDGQRALELAAGSGLRLVAVDALEVLGLAALDELDDEHGLRLLAAASTGRDRLSYPRPPRDEPSHRAAVEGARARLGHERAEAVLREGAGMTLDEATGYARRGRGERRRPKAGWASLTPTELEVVGLVREGLDNASIAQRLFVSRSTVKYHLGQIFPKLGVTSRAQLAAEAARRGV